MNNQLRITPLFLFFLLLNILSIRTLAEIKEIKVFTHVPGFGGFETLALYDENSSHFFFPVSQFLQFIRVDSEISASTDSITGKLSTTGLPFLIDAKKNIIRYNGNVYNLRKNELTKTDEGIYLRSDLFKTIFDFYLTINLKSNLTEIRAYADMPIYQYSRQNEISLPFPYLEGLIPAEKLHKREYHLFRPGMADWGFRTVQQVRKPLETQAELGFGAELLGGEANIFLNLSSKYGMQDTNQFYSWRWINNDNRFIRQIYAGKINPGSLSSLDHSFHGIYLSNTGTTFKRSHGKYRIIEYTEPGWSVELYVNNVLVDLTIADAAGFFSFDVPLVYGSPLVKMKFFGPHGEERIREKLIEIPFNLAEKGKLEYKITGGGLYDNDYAGFGRAELNMGISRFLTLGGGYEYYYSPGITHNIPFAKGSVTPLRNMLISGEYAHEVKYQARFYFHVLSGLAVEAYLASYEPGQVAIHTDIRNEFKASLTSPFKLAGKNAFTLWSYQQNAFVETTLNSASLTYTTRSGKLNPHITAYASWADDDKPSVSSNISASLKLSNSLTLRPNTFIDFTNREFLALRAEVEQRILRSGHLSFVAERNVRTDLNTLLFRLRYEVPFAQTSLTARFEGEDVTVSQDIRGSIAFGRGRVHFSNHMLAGKAGLTIIPYIDVDHDGIKDFDEPCIEGLSIRINKGNICKDSEPAIIIVTGLEAHTTYHLELDDNHLKKSNLWVPVKQLLIETDPNQLKKIHIAVVPYTKLSGAVLLDYQHSGIDYFNANIHIFDAERNLITSIHPDNTGRYSAAGLTPGDYILALDTSGFYKTNLVANPSSFKFTIPYSRQGTVFDFPAIVVKYDVKQDEIQPPADVRPLTPDAVPDSIRITEHAIQQYWLMAGNYIQKSGATELARRLSEQLKRDFAVIEEDGLYKVILNLGTHLEDGVVLGRLLYEHKIDAFIIEKNIEAELPAPLETAEEQPAEEIETAGKATEFFLQAGAFSLEKNAVDLANRITRGFDFKTIIKFNKDLYKVMAGPFSTVEEARAAREILLGNDIDSFIADPE
jgi:hypothetical protein